MTSRKKRPPAGRPRNKSRAVSPVPFAAAPCDWRLPSGQSLGAFALESGLRSDSRPPLREPAPTRRGGKG